MKSEIKRDVRGYYTLYINGQFEGNYDTCAEAAQAYEQVIESEAMVKELVNA